MRTTRSLFLTISLCAVSACAVSACAAPMADDGLEGICLEARELAAECLGGEMPPAADLDSCDPEAAQAFVDEGCDPTRAKSDDDAVQSMVRQVFREDDTHVARFAPDVYRAQVGVLKCARQIIEHKRGGRYGVVEATDILTELDAAGSNLTRIQSVSSRCDAYLSGHGAQGVARRNQYDEWMSLDRSEYSARALRFVDGIILTRANCVRRNMTAAAAILLGVQVSIEVGLCHMSNGRQFFMYGSQLGGDLGAGLLVDADWSDFEGRKWAGWSPVFDIVGFARAAWAVAVAFDNRLEVSTANDPEHVRDVGAGIGVFAGLGAGARGRLLPLGTRDARLHALFYAN